MRYGAWGRGVILNHKRAFLEMSSLEEITDSALVNALNNAFPKSFIKVLVVKDATDTSYKTGKPMSGQYVICDGCGRDYKVPAATWAAYNKNPKQYQFSCPSCGATSWHIASKK